ncbi:MAG: TfoX/Sxy family protein [Saprospiraceae bacterium]
MPFNEYLGERIREKLQYLPNVEEKRMFGGLCFMVENKMCIGIVKDELMCRINPETMESALQMPGCREMDFTGKAMKGFVFVDSSGYETHQSLNYWVDKCLEYNSLAKSSKKKASGK